MRKVGIVVLLFLAGVLNAQEPGYYNGAEGKSSDELKSALHEIINGHIDFSYSDAKYILNYADEDPANASNVILFYTKRSQDKDTYGTGGDNINREHVWAKSHGNFEDIRPMDGDAYNLHPADGSVNITKSNYDFDECSSTGTLIDEAGAYYTSSQFEPSDAAKGEVARTIFYMAVRYEGTNGELDLEAVDAVNTSAKAEHGKLSTLLQWNNDFPPTDLERRRNERVFESQRNRNPFIDNPEYANLIWNGASVSGIAIGQLGMTNPYPKANTTTSLFATITGNTDATLHYGLSWNDETNSSVMTQSGDVWTGNFNLNGFSSGDLVHYKIVAGDGSGTEVLRGTYALPADLTLTDISAVQGTGTSTPMSNATVSIGGIVTANFDNTYYMQNGADPREGVAVYGVQRGRIGDSIVVTGKVVEYNNLTELTSTTYTYVYRQNTPIDPPVISISEADEDYEGCLVKFKGVTFLEGDSEIPVDQSAEIHFTDGSNTMTVYSRYNSRMGGQIVPAGTVDVTGIVSQYQGNYQLLINSIDDIASGEDFDAPLLTGVIVNDADWIEVSFSEKLNKTTAETLSNYSITDGVVVAGAYLYNDTKVLLLVEGILEQDYTLTVINIEDLQGNAIDEETFDFHSDFTSVGINNMEEQGIRIYPNPTSMLLNIENPNSFGPLMIQFLDLNGRLIYENQSIVSANLLTIDVSRLDTGMYILQLRSEGSIIRKVFNITN